MKAILKDLNESQLRAVVNYKGPTLVIAGAGSGKTRVLTSRIAYMLDEGIDPSSILALTFTNKAAAEMKERIAQMVGGTSARRLWMGTFHSVFAKILRIESTILGFPPDFTIYDTIDSKSLIKTIIKELKLDDQIYKPGEVFGRISAAKNNLITAENYALNSEITSRDNSTRRPMIFEIFKRYSVRCKISGAMDFDDLLLYTNILFLNFPEILKKYQTAFNYILVDEYQDTNYSQYLIIKKLSQYHKNICVVGDDAQSIYSFRGARIENILNFRKDYEETELIKLEQNYRSTKNIVDAANSIISQNKDQISKKIFSENAVGEKIKVLEAGSDNEEGFIVANHIKDKLFARGMQYKDFAILYRTNAQSRIFEECLRKMNIPYKIFGSLSFFQRKEIKDILSYFRMVVNPSDEESLKRIINYPLRGLGKTTIAKIEEIAGQYQIPLWNVISQEKLIQSSFNKGTIQKLLGFVNLINGFHKKLQEMEAFDLAYTIVCDSGILKDLVQDKSPEGVSRYENIEALLNSIKEFTDVQDENVTHGLSDYLQTVALYTDADNEKDEDKDKVSIMTVHAAKGLEFKQVFIVGLEEDLFPLQMSSLIPKDLEEERRLFYVALTRAKENAVISYSATRYKWGLLSHCNPSRFIKEIDSQYLDLPYSLHKADSLKAKFQENNSGFIPRNLVRMETIKVDKPEEADDPASINVGHEVEHARFGFGKVISKEGSTPNVKVTVFFKDHGQKQLLLKFAKLRIVRY